MAQSEYLHETRNYASFFVTGFVGDYQSTRCGDLQAGCARADGELDKPRKTLITQRTKTIPELSIITPDFARCNKFVLKLMRLARVQHAIEPNPSLNELTAQAL